jgi:hypothetical protein
MEESTSAGALIVISSPHNPLIITVNEPRDRENNKCGSSAKFKLAPDKVVVKSAYFRRSLSFNSSNGHGNPVLQDDHIDSLHIWFLCMHDVAYADWDSTFKRRIDIETIWHVINAADKYLFEHELAKAGQSFFNKWYTDNVEKQPLEKDFARQLASRVTSSIMPKASLKSRNGLPTTALDT